VHALNYDPIGTEIGHVGVACLPAPLALAEAQEIFGERPDRGSDRLLRSDCPRHSSNQPHRTSASEKFLSGQLLSHFGAAAGAGRILGIDADTMESVFGLALMQMSGSRQMCSRETAGESHLWAFPNQAGVMAAMLAKEGLAARCDVFGPPAGLYTAIYGGDCVLSALTDELGRHFLLDDVEFKPWPSSNQVIHSFKQP